ncbi:MAG: hypothetical protein R6V40_02085 [Candidatus Moraniibacteriota bacterium]
MKLNKKSALFYLLAGLALTSTGWLAYSANAYLGDCSQRGPNCNEERHQEIIQALEDNDYKAWSNLMNNKGKVTQAINEDNFSQFTKAYKLAQEGKYDEADQIREELDLRKRDGKPTGNNYERGKEMKQKQGMFNR